ncbi:alkaline phosphatase family protein [Methylocystis heyeri]|uniref:Phosphoesterase n=1 Tax=Methylocystis heyeri TaxID=391905 RepID=A0A6B8KBG6_9HYPH|nr:alkaline phosphatase family protein [Methylocystis heyeri]QGM45017.1 phosphoesterase [Methylocystis heyeri]
MRPFRLLGFAAALFALAAAFPAKANENRGLIDHVFVIVLENEGYDVTFGPGSKAPYLSTVLPTRGVLLSQYYGTGHFSLDNYIAMVSGQAATPETRNDCAKYADFNVTGATPDGQVIGSGCVYPASVKTIADQLMARHKTWRAYMGDMGADPARESATCGHPQINSTDLTQTAEAPSSSLPHGDSYATRHNPFMYFHSVIDRTDICNANVVNLDLLANDLKSEATTPNFAFITPSLCDDGHDAPCVDGRPGGLVSADAFLKQWVPVIVNSPAFRHGLLAIIFDESGASSISQSGGNTVVTFKGDTCCNQQPGPNLGSFPQTVTLGSYNLTVQNFGGDRTGAVLLSPFLKPGTVSNTFFNHYSLLKTVEDIFGVEDHLGYAGQQGLLGFFGCASSDIALGGSDRHDVVRPEALDNAPNGLKSCR